MSVTDVMSTNEAQLREIENMQEDHDIIKCRYFDLQERSDSQRYTCIMPQMSTRSVQQGELLYSLVSDDHAEL